MHAHLAIHFNHGHDTLIERVARDVSAALGQLNGPGMTQQERLERDRADARNHNYDYIAL